MSQDRAEAIHDRYRKGFVGRSRATRDLAALDSIISDTRALLDSGLSGELGRVVNERMSTYLNERTEIAAIQAQGPAVVAAWRNVEWSDLANSRYARHFAGQARPTRDLGLLIELAENERGFVAAMPADADERLRARRDQMVANTKLYEGEIPAIREARRILAPAEEARVLAGLANQQFAWWRLCFEGKTRVTRRPGLLARMISALEEIRGEMQRVRDIGVRTAGHDGNIQRVSERITSFQTELDRIKAARLEARASDMSRMLGDEANKIFAAYRAEFAGKPRDAADPARLGDLCDQLHEIAGSMQLLLAERQVAQTARNLDVVIEQLRMMEREHTAIVAARKKK